MKTFLAIAFLSIALQSNSFAYEQKGPCAKVAAKAALTYASESWNVLAKNQSIEFSTITPSSNPAPIQIYSVGIVREDNRLVQFDVGLDYVNGKCLVKEVRFTEYAE